MSFSSVCTGYARLDITGPLGVPLSGYFEPRPGTGLLDPLLATALALESDGQRAVLISCDLIGMPMPLIARAKAAITQATGLPGDAVYIACTHTHLGPKLDRSERFQPPLRDLYEAVFGHQDDAYLDMLVRKLADAAVLALQDLHPVRISVGRGREDSVSFIRRFKMRGGRTMTNPRRGDPDIIEPIGCIDPAVTVLRFMPEAGEPTLLVHFALHPDTISGSCYSADYPGFLRRFIEQTMPGTRVIYVNGTCGDINHLNPLATSDRPQSGYEASRRIGTTLGAEVLKILQHMDPLDGARLRMGSRIVETPATVWPEEEAARSAALLTDYIEGRYEQRTMDDTARLGHSFQVLVLSQSPATFRLPVSALTLGDWAMTGFPGEPFVGIGKAVKAASPFAVTLSTCCTNGYEDYYPMAEAYAEGGYEAMNSPYRPGVAEALIEGAHALLKELAAR